MATLEKLSRGQTLYFWGRIAGILLLAMAGVLCLGEGIDELSPALGGAGAAFELASLALAWTLQPPVPTVPSIRECADAMAGVSQVERVLTVRLGRERVLVALGLRFEPALSRREMIATAAQIQRAIRRAHPQVERVFMAVHGGR